MWLDKVSKSSIKNDVLSVGINSVNPAQIVNIFLNSIAIILELAQGSYRLLF
jgi:hypothetical protein